MRPVTVCSPSVHRRRLPRSRPRGAPRASDREIRITRSIDEVDVCARNRKRSPCCSECPGPSPGVRIPDRRPSSPLPFVEPPSGARSSRPTWSCRHAVSDDGDVADVLGCVAGHRCSRAMRFSRFPPVCKAEGELDRIRANHAARRGRRACLVGPLYRQPFTLARTATTMAPVGHKNGANRAAPRRW